MRPGLSVARACLLGSLVCAHSEQPSLGPLALHAKLSGELVLQTAGRLVWVVYGGPSPCSLPPSQRRRPQKRHWQGQQSRRRARAAQAQGRGPRWKWLPAARPPAGRRASGRLGGGRDGEGGARRDGHALPSARAMQHPEPFGKAQPAGMLFCYKNSTLQLHSWQQVHREEAPSTAASLASISPLHQACPRCCSGRAAEARIPATRSKVCNSLNSGARRGRHVRKGRGQWTQGRGAALQMYAPQLPAAARPL